MTNNYCTTTSLPAKMAFLANPASSATRQKSYDQSVVRCEVDMQVITTGKASLAESAKSVSQQPNLKNCGFCHFYGSGGDSTNG